MNARFVTLKKIRVAAEAIGVVAVALMVLHNKLQAQDTLVLTSSKPTRMHITRAKATRMSMAGADTTRRKVLRIDTVLVAHTDTTVRADTSVVDSARTVTVDSTAATIAQVDSVAAKLTRADSINTDSMQAMESKEVVRDSMSSNAVRADTLALVQADSMRLDSAAAESEAAQIDSAAMGSADRAITETVSAPLLEVARTSLVAHKAKKSSSTFSQTHLNNERVLSAKVEKRFELKKLFRDRGLSYPAEEIFLRAFKRERELEVWVRSSGQAEFTLLKSYRICALGTQVGPKVKQGDEMTPEGFYYIDTYNPSSGFLLSLGLDYPNRSDRLRNPSAKLGGDIFIHGGCKTLGCMAVTDDAIKELYWLAVEARDAGQKIPVHIFPTKLTDVSMHNLMAVFESRPDLKRFWTSLKPGYDFFEVNHRLPTISVDDQGWYKLVNSEPVVVATEANQPKTRN